MADHKTQLLVCHQRIGDTEPRGRWHWGWTQRRRWAYCSLAAYAWCRDCEFYVCDVHAQARHEVHDLDVEFPENTTAA